jgi:DNA primase
VSEVLARQESDGCWRANCPYCDDDEHCLSINDALTLFYCFACGNGGTLAAFIFNPMDARTAFVCLSE